MDYKINGYRPEKLFHFFEDISMIPRGSGNEKEISDFLVGFAKERGLWVYQDDSWNVIIKKEGSAGAKEKPPVMLQGHMDMVCDKRAGISHDFEKEGIRLQVKDGVLSADGTTLGADNGAAVALMLALLDDRSAKHPPLECVFTASEEAGLKGARALDKSLIKARTMINLDSEEEGTVSVSCAGGARIRLQKKITGERVSGTLVTMKTEGLLGGHSGTDIDKDRTNAVLLMAAAADQLIKKTDGKLAAFSGGTKDNAIPRECVLSFVYEKEEDAMRAASIAAGIARDMEKEIRAFEADFSCRVETVRTAETAAVPDEDAKAFIGALRLAPNGVFHRNMHMDGFVVSSSSIGIARTEEDRLLIVSAPRSSVALYQEDTKERFRILAETFGFEMTVSGEYPGWSYREDSRIREIFRGSYHRLFGGSLKTEALHAGLECGVFVDALPGLDAIAAGPTLYDVHTPDERVELDSFERIDLLLRDVLKVLSEM